MKDLTVEQAYEELTKGNVLIHNLLSEDEYIYMINNIIIDENGYKLGSWEGFMSYRTGDNFKTGWSVDKERTVSVFRDRADDISLTPYMSLVNYNQPYEYDYEPNYINSTKNIRSTSTLLHKPNGQGGYVKEEHINRNDPCPCGSGKKYKKCCINN